ncbi:MAG: PH domain-containing protein [Actinomycetota bacterium]|nr:PH domain-containing protein [Actinomycetota bacterium]
MQTQEPFAPPGAAWTAVSPKLRTVRLISAAIQLGFLALVGTVLAVLVPWWTIGAGIVVVALLGMGLAAWLVTRQVAAIGYDVGADALTITNGLLFRQLVVVPYARMQYVDVQAGPLLRRFGLATVQLHTASAATDARIPGLPAQVAADLRDELARLGETKSVGL